MWWRMACHEAFEHYNVILETKKTGLGTLNHIFFKRIGQQEQPELAVDIDDPRPSTSTM